MSTFKRARSETQREIRRKAILETAAAMLAEMPVSTMSLNELSRRVGLAKSNVLRYFDSREGVLLELLVEIAHDFSIQIGEQLPQVVELDEPARTRAASVATALATAFETHPMLCELLSTQAGILEHNVSAEAAAKYKRSGYQSLFGLTAALRQVLPELSEKDAAEAARAVVVLAGALWTHSHPPQAVQEACAIDPSLEFLPEGFAGALERTFGLVLLGLLANSI